MQILLSATVANLRNSTINIQGIQSIDQSHFSSTVNLSSLDIDSNVIRYVSTCTFNKIILTLYLHYIILCYSHLFVVVTTKQSIVPSQVPDSDIVSYNESVNMYVTAVVSNLTGDQWKRELVIGDGSSYHYDGIIYYNAPLIKGNTYYSFVRAYGNKAVSLLIGYTV